MKKEDLNAYYQYDPDTGILKNKKGQSVGTVSIQGYLVVNLRGKCMYCHRIGYALHYGTLDKNVSIDHIDGNKLNNTISNLRAVSHKTNLRNQKLRSTNKSGQMGVYRHGDRWRVRITVDGKYKHIGIFDTKELAVQARKQAEKQHGFHENHGR